MKQPKNGTDRQDQRRAEQQRRAMLDEERGHVAGGGIRPRGRTRQQRTSDEQDHGDHSGPSREQLGVGVAPGVRLYLGRSTAEP